VVLGCKNIKTLINLITKTKNCFQLGLDIGENFIKSDSEMRPNIKLSKLPALVLTLEGSNE